MRDNHLCIFWNDLFINRNLFMHACHDLFLKWFMEFIFEMTHGIYSCMHVMICFWNDSWNLFLKWLMEFIHACMSWFVFEILYRILFLKWFMDFIFDSKQEFIHACLPWINCFWNDSWNVFCRILFLHFPLYRLFCDSLQELFLDCLHYLWFD